MSGDTRKEVVAAIDFGTTFSGYAFSLLHQHDIDPLKTFTNYWVDGSGLITLRAPTVVLFDKEKNFDSFGYDAETKYASLSKDDNHHGWRYFRRFKMKLYEQVNIHRDMTLKDDQNNDMPALDVFAESIKYLKDHLMKNIKEITELIQETSFYWVLTVPAIWDDGAKQFMKEAAAKAGIPEDHLTLVLEPEAAAIYCKELVVSTAIEQNKEADLQSFRPDAQFIVLDLGGGTVDITVHEVESDGTLTELDSPSGGPWGGTMVDKEIDSFLEDLFGTDLMKEFRTKYKDDDLDLQRTIEKKKRLFKNTEAEIFKIKLPNALYELYKEKTQTSFESSLSSSRFVESVSKNRDMLQISNDIFLNMFAKSKDNLVCHIGGLLRKKQIRNVKTLVMVGVFSESEIMQNAVKRAFPTMNVIVPNEAGLAVVKGAVMFGHNTDLISARKLLYTYGISTAVPFDERKHPKSKKVNRDDLTKCEDVFKVFIEAGTKIVPHKTYIQETFFTPFAGESKAVVEIYRSGSRYPRYVSDIGCHRIGEIEISLIGSSTTTKQMIDVSMLFGYTLLHVEVREHGTGNMAWAKFNFLR